MAEIPRPIGLGVVLVDLANGIGAAARALPEESQSFVGAVAMKTAKVRIDFEMAQATTQRDAGLGIRTNQIFGIGTVENATVTRGASKGFIEFEVVAITTPAESAPGRPARDPQKAAAIAEAKAKARKKRAEARAAEAAEAPAAAIEEAKDEARKKAEAEAEAGAAKAKAAAIDEAKDAARKEAEAEARAAKAKAAAIDEARDKLRKAADLRAAAAKVKPATGKDG